MPPLIEPSREKTQIDLQDGQGAIELWFNAGALYELADAIGQPDARIVQLHALVEGITFRNLHLYLWAGERWRGTQRPKQEVYRQRVAEMALPIAPVYNVVGGAIILNTTAKPTERADPGPRAATNGTGSLPSDSPSPNSD